MTETWRSVRPQVRALLSDVDETEYSNKDLIGWWNNAQIRLAAQKPQTRHQIYTCDDGNPVKLPDYHYMPVAVFVKSGVEPLKRLSPDLALLDGTQVGFYLYEHKLIISGLLRLPERWLYVYNSYFPKIINDKSPVLAPDWSLEALTYYVGIQAMSRKSVDDARYRQYTAPPDATGNPVHNPYLKVAEFFEKRYNAIVSQHVDDDEDFRW